MNLKNTNLFVDLPMLRYYGMHIAISHRAYSNIEIQGLHTPYYITIHHVSLYVYIYVYIYVHINVLWVQILT